MVLGICGTAWIAGEGVNSKMRRVWLTQAQAANHLKLSLRTVQRKTASGQITAHKPFADGRTIRYLHTELDAHLLKGKVRGDEK